MRFPNRRTAGQELGLRLKEWASAGELPQPVVLALPRGGVPVAAEVAQVLDAPLDVLVARKVGLPGRPETGIGAVVADDPPLFDQRALAMAGLSEGRLAQEVARERVRLKRRAMLYRDPSTPHVENRTVVLVDDGLATGATARAALRHLRRARPARLILAVPVGAPETVAEMRSEADAVVCLRQPPDFRAVGLWYDDFDQVGDDRVVEILNGYGTSSSRT
ncbi:phosphoribosyltransferase [Streptomyces salinarius]|uniref:phosphoribosyltransferase n=1 Tax=Streptomyces salinarius TaxID=2762598 RepID=UPI0016483C3D|nr:phosphoribosyltransferase family protein [Streptomyces salinarius]